MAYPRREHQVPSSFAPIDPSTKRPRNCANLPKFSIPLETHCAKEIEGEFYYPIEAEERIFASQVIIALHTRKVRLEASLLLEEGDNQVRIFSLDKISTKVLSDNEYETRLNELKIKIRDKLEQYAKKMAVTYLIEHHILTPENKTQLSDEAKLLITYKPYFDLIKAKKISIGDIQHLSAKEFSNLLDINVMKLIKTNKLSFRIAKIISPNARDMLTNPFYCDLIANNRWSLNELQSLDNDQRDNLLQPAIIDLIATGHLTLNQAKKLPAGSGASISLNSFISDLIKQKMIRATDAAIALPKKNLSFILPVEIVALVMSMRLLKIYENNPRKIHGRIDTFQKIKHDVDAASLTRDDISFIKLRHLIIKFVLIKIRKKIDNTLNLKKANPLYQQTDQIIKHIEQDEKKHHSIDAKVAHWNHALITLNELTQQHIAKESELLFCHTDPTSFSYTLLSPAEAMHTPEGMHRFCAFISAITTLGLDQISEHLIAMH